MNILALLTYGIIFLPLGLIPWRRIFVIEPLFKMTLEDIFLLLFCFHFTVLFIYHIFLKKINCFSTKNTLNVLIFIYLFFVFVSFFQGLYQSELKYEPFRQMKGIVYLLAFFTFQQFIQSEEKLKKVFSFILFLALVCALYQLLFIKFPSLINFYGDGYIVSYQGSISGFPRIFFAGSIFFLPILPVLVVFAFSSWIKNIKRYMLLAIFIFLFIVFSLTLIFNLTVQTLIAVIIVIGLRYKKKRNFNILINSGIVISLIGLFVCISKPTEIEKIQNIVNTKLKASKLSLEEGNFAYRIQQIPKAWKAMKEIDLSFLIGIGLGTGYETDLVYKWDPTKKYRAPSLELNHLNAFLLLGSLGAIAYSLLVLYFTLASIKRYLKVRKSRWEPYQLSVVLIWILGLINPYGGYFWYAQGNLLLALLFFVHTFVGRMYYQEKQSLSLKESVGV